MCDNQMITKVKEKYFLYLPEEQVCTQEILCQLSYFLLPQYARCSESRPWAWLVWELSFFTPGLSALECRPSHVSRVSAHLPYVGHSAILLRVSFYNYGAWRAQLVERPTEKPGAILTRVRVPGVARDFCPSQLPVQTLLRCPYSPRVQSHASTSERTLKIPNAGSHTIAVSYTHLTLPTSVYV